MSSELEAGKPGPRVKSYAWLTALGTVSINTHHWLVPETPFGGVKQSGYGREGVIEGIKAFLEAKTIHINMNMPRT